jgi:methylated-DNA-protein-cysteine methyltransferase related protein
MAGEDSKLKRRIVRDGLRPDEIRDEAIRRAVRSIPRGRVATYGEVAAAAGYPLYHRLVARILGKAGDRLPWQRVVGAGGYIKLRGGSALEQRMRLEMEGVGFRGTRVDIEKHRHTFALWLEG